jgi:hypothetical protein
MKEEFLHYLWKFSKFDTSVLQTANREQLSIIHPGQYLQLAGPDFFNAQLMIGSQQWAGNIELHLKSSDWYIHHHESDAAYENVILHVVWEHDTEVYRKDNSEIAVLELRHYVDVATIENYRALSQTKSWIFCEKQIATVDPFIRKHWLERLFFERLEKKSQPITDLLQQTQSDWEAVLFILLAKNFGLNTNGDTFMKVAINIPFQVIRKESTAVENIEALLFGFAGLLENEKEDQYYLALQSQFDYLSQKYRLVKAPVAPVQFFKHRPDNFPTIRLSQLASLYSKEKHLFSKTIDAVSVIMLYQIFDVSVSGYWKNHYRFDRESPQKEKSLSMAFVNLLIINTVVPFQFAYGLSQGKEVSENVVRLMEQIAPESNSVIDKFKTFGVDTENALDSQSLLQLKNEYCAKGRCLSCAIGMELLKNNAIKE